ncbi:MAG: hypothetical protein PVI23_03160 [Maricaulaceae bacterium]|jgi:hypothetical protein
MRILLALCASVSLAAIAVAQDDDDRGEGSAAPVGFDPTAGIDITEATRNIVEAAIAQAELYAERPDDYEPPRMSNGKPNLQGNWSTASHTGMTRGRGFDSLVMSQEQAVQAIAQHPQNIRQATDDGQSLDDGLLNGADLARGRGYNSFWIDPGTSYAVVKGEWRTSWITYPEDGQIPALTEEARAERAAMGGGRRGSGYDNPEERGLAERCIMLPVAGPPLGQYLYNNNISIVQTDDHVVIMAEMIHDARIVRLNAEHNDNGVQPWFGDSIGWWDGDTLVVETTDINPEQRRGRMFFSEDAVITERFSRWNDYQLLYEFAVEDPAYEESWGGEISLNRNDDGVFEYACHEGNHGMVGILAGGRRQDGSLDAQESGSGEE